jgi:hypothetical protein
MRSQIIGVLFATILVLLPSSPNAGVGFTLQKTLSIPGFSDTILQVRFKDLDGDGTPEILAASRNKYYLYSPARDSVLDSITVVPVDSIETILLEDVDRDSIPDIVLTGTRRFYDYGIVMISGASHYHSAEARGLRRFMSMFNGCVSGPNLAIAQDVNGDGYNELLVSAEVINSTILGGKDFENTVGESLVYYSFPDSVLSDRPIYFDLGFPLPLNGARPSLWLRSSECQYIEGLGYPMSTVGWSNSLLSQNDSLHMVPVPSPPFCANLQSIIQKFEPRASHVDILDSAFTDFLATSQTNYICVGDSLWQERKLLGLYRIDTTLNVTLAWSVDIGTTPYSSFIFLPDLPGYFLAFTDNSVLLFREADGSIKDIVSDVPRGIRLWEYPDADGKVRLVTLRGDSISIYTPDVTTGVDDHNQNGSVPASFTLGNPYPNPFNPSTTVEFNLPKRGEVVVTIFNILGQPVRILAHETLAAGEHSITWDGTNDAGHNVASGVYFCRVETATQRATVKMLLLR